MRAFLTTWIILAAIMCGTISRAAEASPNQTEPKKPLHAREELRFPWQPLNGPPASYDLLQPEDQHRIVLFPGMSPGTSYPVVVAMHGQPARGKAPHEYAFFDAVLNVVAAMVESKEIPPIALVMPAFRFNGQNWPKFDLRCFRDVVEHQLKMRGMKPGSYFVFGHSGAAGCGGDGLNRAHRLKPEAVGFFDTCLGEDWQEEIRRLTKLHIRTVNIHSVETAGFKPRQRPEYQSSFDFGRAYDPVGLAPVACPKTHPGERLREQPYQCAATEDGLIQGFVVDSGEGEAAHLALLPIAVRYFLKTYLNVSK